MSKGKHIIESAKRHWKVILGIYLIQALAGLVVAISLGKAMNTTMGESMVLDHLAMGFDRTVIIDVLNTRSDIMDSTQRIAFVLVGLYMMISIALHAGWLSNIRKQQHSLGHFIKGIIIYFLPFLGIAVLTVLLVFGFGILVGFVFTISVGDPLVTFSSEKPLVLWIIGLIILFIFWAILLWGWSLSTRFHYIDGRSFITSLRLGFRTLKRYIWQIWTIGLLMIGLNALLMYIHYSVMADRGASSWTIVLFGILLHQVFALGRIFIQGIGYVLLDDMT